MPIVILHSKASIWERQRLHLYLLKRSHSINCCIDWIPNHFNFNLCNYNSIRIVHFLVNENLKMNYFLSKNYPFVSSWNKIYILETIFFFFSFELKFKYCTYLPRHTQRKRERQASKAGYKKGWNLKGRRRSDITKG